jgi:hypothetical protein
VSKVFRVFKEFKVSRELQVPKETTEVQEIPDQLDLKVYKGRQGL